MEEWKTRPCGACGATGHDHFVDGSIACTECRLPILERDIDYLRRGMTPTGRMLPDRHPKWAPCEWCGYEDPSPCEGSGAVSCEDCGAPLLARMARTYTPQNALAEMWASYAARPFEMSDPISVGDSVVASAREIAGAGPFTRLWVTAVHDDDCIDLTRDSDGTIWSFVPAEYVISRGAPS